jgi:seryl-tRNA synthetase
MAKDKNKLNPLKTSFEVEVAVDGVNHKLVFKPVNKIIQEKLNSNRNQSKAQYEDVDSKRAELKEIKELKAINDEILTTYIGSGADKENKDGISLKQRTTILMENKDFITKISSLEKEIKKLQEEVLDVNSAIENFYKQMFEECVSGEDRVKLQKTIEENGISYNVIITYIDEAMREAQEKK